LKNIKVVQDWGTQMANSEKVPSVISYSPPSKAKKELQWGSSLSDGAVAMINTKLELDNSAKAEELDLILQALDGMKNLNFDAIKAARGLPEYTFKAPEDIVADYLCKVFDHFYDHTLKEMSEALLDRINVDIVITVPVVSQNRACRYSAGQYSTCHVNSPSRNGPTKRRTRL
jgi:molecular chaperone DnaK (HSP70)